MKNPLVLIFAFLVATVVITVITLPNIKKAQSDYQAYTQQSLLPEDYGRREAEK